jgi:hypothetical protein
MNLDDVSPGLSRQPLETQIRTVASRINADLKILEIEITRDWRNHIRNRVRRIRERQELLYGLVKKAMSKELVR